MSDHQHTHHRRQPAGRRLAMPCDVSPMPFHLYRPYVPLVLTDRTWPDRQTDRWPPSGPASTCATATRRWSTPWTPERKLQLFQTLVDIGFKEIEVGFPSASQTDYDFQRQIIDERAHPRRRDHPGAGPVPGGADRADLRVAARGQAGHRPLLQLDVDAAAPGGLRPRPAGHRRHRRQRRPAVQEVRVDRARHRHPLRVLAGELHRHRARVRRRDLRGGDGGHRAHARSADHHQPAQHRRDVRAQRLRRRHRMVRPDRRPTGTRSSSASIPTTTGARRWPRPSWPSWPAPTGWRGRCSATGSAPATSTWSPWP